MKDETLKLINLIASSKDPEKAIAIAFALLEEYIKNPKEYAGKQ